MTEIQGYTEVVINKKVQQKCAHWFFITKKNPNKLFRILLTFWFRFPQRTNFHFSTKVWNLEEKKTILVSIPFENRSKIGILFASERCGKQLSSLLFSSRTGLLSHHLENRKIYKNRENENYIFTLKVPSNFYSSKSTKNSSVRT